MLDKKGSVIQLNVTVFLFVRFVLLCVLQVRD